MSESQPETRGETRRLAAIMFTDIAGFSRQMGADESRTLRLLAVHNQIIQQAATAHHGTVIKTIGDAFLVDFPSVVHAVQCAQQIQAQFKTYNAEKEQPEQIHVRIGVHSGDIVQQHSDVFGDGVNVASRLQGLAEPDTICISQKVYEEVESKLALGTVLSLGRPQLKNIAQRQHVYLLLSETPQGLRKRLQVQRLKLSRRVRPAHRLMLAGLLLIAVTLGVIQYFRPLSTQDSALRTAAALPLPNKPSIVVRLFANLSNDPEQEYFSRGITLDITSELSKLASLFVIASGTGLTLSPNEPITKVGQELGVRYVLDGSVRRAGEQVRVTVQLSDAVQDHLLWSERYDREFKDIFPLQDEIVRKIMTTLKLRLEGYIVRKTTDNLEAYDFLLRGLEASQRSTKEAITVQARQMYEKAVALAPQYAEAHARLGFTYYLEWSWQWNSDPQNLERALALAQKAIALDDSLPAAHGLLGTVYARKQQYDQALAEGERAVLLDPNNADAYAGQATILNLTGRPEEALRSAEQAMRLNPHYPPFYSLQLGWAYQLTGRYAEAIAISKSVLVRNPNMLGAYVPLLGSYIQQRVSQLDQDPSTLEQALAAAQRALALNDANFANHSFLGHLYLLQKQYELAIAKLERTIALNPNDAWGYAGLAEALSRIGRSEEAVAMAAEALRRKSFVADQHLNSVGAAYDLAGKPGEAIAPLKQFLSHYPNILGAHLTLAAVYSELGKEAEAHAEAAEVLRINPKFSLEVHKERVPIKDPALLERHIEALRKAGLK
jgi:adenylate cyclase